MAFTDESDLSESLSSPGSTIPLPSSELGSRQGSQELQSPTGPVSLAQPPFKIDRRRKPRPVKSKPPSISLTCAIPDKDSKPKKSRVISRSNGLNGSSSTPTDPDRLVKSESLPPPTLPNRSRRSSLSLVAPRSASVKGSGQESLMPHVDSNGLHSSTQHHSTSHGRLPLFEQPVVLQGARPRRTTHLIPPKATKTKSTKRTRSYKLNGEIRPPNSDQASPSKLNSPEPSFQEPNYKDDESSLTEQSSSDDDKEPNSQSTPSDGFRTPSSQLSRKSTPLIVADTEHTSASTKEQAGDCSIASKLAVPSGPSEPSASELQPKISPATDHLPPQLPSAPCSPTPAQNNSIIPDRPRSPPSPFLNNPSGLQSPSKLNGRDASEESALTPEPEDDRHLINKPLKQSNDDPVPLDSNPSSVQPDHTSEPFTELNNSEETSRPLTNSKPIDSPLPINPSHQPTHRSSPVPHEHHGPQSVDPAHKSENQSGATTPTAIKSNQPPPYPGTPPEIDLCLGDDLERGPTYYLAEDGLDGEPITDDLMEYNLDFVDPSTEMPTLEKLLELHEPSDAGTSAVDGVPVPESEDLVEDVEHISPTEPESKKEVTTITPVPLPDCQSHPPTVEEQKLDESERPKPVKRSSNEVVYEHDDQVRRRESALEALVKIEILFAQVRDRLYLERMTDVHRETTAIHEGLHPELNEYCKLLQRKRDARLSLAHKIFHLREAELTKKREAAANAAWTKWHEAKTELRNVMLAETQRRMKQLDRERCQPDLRYNVEVQFLARPIIPKLNQKNRSSRKRAKLDLSREEVLALQLHGAVARRATVNLSTLTPEESQADLAIMRPPPSIANHLDPVNILRAPHPGCCSQQVNSSSINLVTQMPLSKSDSNPSKDETNLVAVDRPSIGAVNPDLLPTRLYPPPTRPSNHEPDLEIISQTPISVQQERVNRRPTLDTVMAHNTPERLKVKNNTSNETNPGQIKTHSLPAQIFPSVPMSVNYH